MVSPFISVMFCEFVCRCSISGPVSSTATWLLFKRLYGCYNNVSVLYRELQRAWPSGVTRRVGQCGEALTLLNHYDSFELLCPDLAAVGADTR